MPADSETTPALPPISQPAHCCTAHAFLIARSEAGERGTPAPGNRVLPLVGYPEPAY